MKSTEKARQRRQARSNQSYRRRIRLEVELLEDRTLLSGNPIVTENQLAGTPQSTWDVGTGNTTIQGFATNMSVNHGQTISFKINDSSLASYHIEIYRLGYYGGNGARLVATIPSAQVLRQVQPNPLTNTATGLVDAGNWAVSASWAVPATATSGLYFARPTRDDNGGASAIYFVVRADESTSDLVFQTADTTWQAYNQWGGNSLYVGPGLPDGRAYKVSYNRPLTVDAFSGGGGDYNSPMHAEYPMIRWLEANGYDTSYFTDVDSDRNGALIRNHKVYLSVGHDEYWSGQQRANVEAARDAGVHLAFFSGNEIFWKTRWENSIDGSGTSYRTLVCYKESKNNARIDPLDVSPTWTWTGTWRDTRFSPPSDGGRPENALSGNIYMNDRTNVDLGIPLQVPEAEGKLRFWRNTSVATLPPGQMATLGQYIVGYETDEDLDNGFRPGGLITMSTTSFSTPSHVTVPWGTEVGPGSSTHKITLYRAPGGALVFGAGSVQWSWGLDGTHNNTPTTPDPAIRQATVNLFADMGVQPGSLQPGLVAATASTDTTKPTSTITSPAPGTVMQVGTPVTITGTAVEAGGGRLAVVEVSTDSGATWHRTTGLASWSYAWTPTVSGPTVIKSRAVDDSVNIEIPGAGVSVTVSSSNTLVAAYGFNEGTGTTTADLSGKGNTGTVANTIWSTTGKYGKALSFNGTNSWVTVNDANSLDLTTALTLEAWVNPAALTFWRTVILKEAGTDEVYSIYANEDAPRPEATIRIGTTYYPALGNAPLPLNTWTHLASTYDSATLRLYVNGTQVGSVPATGNITVSAGALRIGGNSIWGEYFNGLIDEVRVYNRALAQSEIQTDMNTPVGGVADTQAPTAPTNLTASGGIGAISLTWTASTDNVGVTNYNVHRSTTPGFTPTTANRIAQPASNSYTDSGMSPGTYYYRVTAQDAAGNLSPSSNEASGTATADTTAPTVSITAPANGATVSGTITVSANASDNVGVAGVQFLLDGANLGAEDTAAPYAASWDTSTATNGGHTLTARARDAAGNQTTSSAVTVTVSNQAPTGLVAAYGFNEGSGTTTADASGTGNTGTLANTTWSTGGKYGGALSFNGVNSWVTINDAASLDLTTALTLEAWVNPIALVSWRTVIMKEAGTEEVYSIYANETMPRPVGAVRIAGTYQIANGAAQLPVNTWSHLASTYDGATLRLYVNGTQVGSVPATGPVEVSSGVLRIGGNSIWGEYFSGLIDEVRVYNRALNQAQIQTDMNTPIGSPERLLGEAVAAEGVAPLSQEELRPLFDEALTRWSAALGEAEAVERLRSVQVEIMDLPGTTLGLASSTVIFIDVNGAGHGWFLDPTAGEDSEFALDLADSPAAGRVDLLTVLTHEMGHILGLDDDSATDPVTGNVMADVLPLGVRRIHLEGLVSEAAISSTTPPVSGASPVLVEAVARWADSGVRGEDLASLASVAVRIADPPGSELGGTGAKPGSLASGIFSPAPPVDAGVAVLLTAVPMIGTSATPAGPVPSRRGDEVPEAWVPGTAKPPDPFSREDVAGGFPALLEPRAGIADRTGVDLLFADLGRTPDDPLPRDWWL